MCHSRIIFRDMYLSRSPPPSVPNLFAGPLLQTLVAGRACRKTPRFCYKPCRKKAQACYKPDVFEALPYIYIYVLFNDVLHYPLHFFMCHAIVNYVTVYELILYYILSCIVCCIVYTMYTICYHVISCCVTPQLISFYSGLFYHVALYCTIVY